MNPKEDRIDSKSFLHLNFEKEEPLNVQVKLDVFDHGHVFLSRFSCGYFAVGSLVAAALNASAEEKKA